MRARKLLPFCLSERKMRASCVITSLQKLVLWGKSLKYHKTYDKNWENWQFVASQRCLSFRYALLTNKAFPEVYKRCKAILLQQYHYLEEITFPGKDTDCHLLSTTTEMEGPAREKKKIDLSWVGNMLPQYGLGAAPGKSVKMPQLSTLHLRSESFPIPCGNWRWQGYYFLVLWLCIISKRTGEARASHLLWLTVV